MAVKAARYSPLPEARLFIALLVTFAAASGSLLAGPAGQAQAAGDIPRLTSGVITKDIGGGQQQRHVIGLTEGQFLRVVVEPMAIDLKILLKTIRVVLHRNAF